MHGFCTDFARFQNVQRVLFAAKSDKECRNYRVKNHVALIKNNDDSKLPEIETNRRLALLISGPRVRVPGGAPQQQNPNFFPIGEGFGFFVFYGRKISIDCTGVEDALDVTMAQQTELDYLIYNDPLGYADLILNGDPKEYLKNVSGSRTLED